MGGPAEFEIPRDPAFTQRVYLCSSNYSNPRQDYADAEYPVEAYEYYDAGYADYETRYEDGRTYANDSRTAYAAEYERAPRPAPGRPQRLPPRVSRGRPPPPRVGGPERKRDLYRAPPRPGPYDEPDRLDKRRKLDKPDRVGPPLKDRRERRS